jgi:asparagine synthase (glutamine-hydrolysing)
MCGISGVARWREGGALVDRMNEMIAHRGPDGSGRWSSPLGDVHLGHRRLSILDLTEAASQPFVKDGLVMVYNGELYNFVELRRELQALGATFTSTGDSEVLLEAWRAWGPDALPRLRGMFAVAIFDMATGRLVLARDQLGIKPLFYTQRTDGGLAFASELKALTAALDHVELDHTAMVASLLYYWVPDQHCAIAGVHKLAPGHWLEMTPDGTTATHRFFDPVATAAEAAAGDPVELRSVIVDSVRRHLLADVPVSTFLSGGLDSSLLTVLAKRANPAVDAYTIAFRSEDQKLEAMPDDLHYARMVARRNGIDLHEIEIAPDIVDLWPKLVWSLDEPIGDAAAINTVLICDAARRNGVKVLLSGMGADELFGGYRKHYATLLAQRYQRMVPGAVRRNVVSPLVSRMPVAIGGRGVRSTRWAQRFVSFGDLPEEAAFRRSYTHYDHDSLAALIDPGLAPAVGQLIDEHAAIYWDTPFDDAVNRMCLTDVRMFLVGLNLTYTDRASMASSTEVRVPFVDVEVMKAAFSYPAAAKIAGRERKAILKQAAEPYLPREVIYRPKGLFSAPLRAWIQRDLTEMVDDLLPRGELVQSGFLRTEAIRSMIDDDRSGRADYSKHIWQMLTLELWYRRMREVGAGPVGRSMPVAA